MVNMPPTVPTTRLSNTTPHPDSQGVVVLKIVPSSSGEDRPTISSQQRWIDQLSLPLDKNDNSIDHVASWQPTLLQSLKRDNEIAAQCAHYQTDCHGSTPGAMSEVDNV